MATKRVGNITINYTVPEAQTQLYNAIGRTAGNQAATQQNTNQGGGDNFFTKRGRSIENAFGTTGSAIVSAVNDRIENDRIARDRKDARKSMNDIAKKYGFNSWSDWQDANSAARESGDTEAIKRFDTQLKEFQAQANANAAKANKKAANYEDYRKKDYISNKINQDRGKFAGSAINTLSTAVDVTGLGATPVSNAIQGGIEGVADELEQNGFENFDWGRAGQNAAIGATTGLVTGALNKGISNSLAKRAAAKGLTNTATKAGIGGALKNGARTIASGAARGAVSGAVGGATGAGLQSAMNGVEFGQGVQNALQGAVQGARQGAVTGGIMAGANAAFGKTNFGKQLQNAKTNWDRSGSNFDERLTNTLTSGDSAVGDWLMNKRQSKVLGAAGNLGNSVRDVNGWNRPIDPEKLSEVERAYAYGELTPDELVNAYNNGEIPETAITDMWGASTPEAREAINTALSKSQRWQGEGWGEIRGSRGPAPSRMVEMTTGGDNQPIATKRVWAKDGKEYDTFEYPRNGGVGIAVLDENGDWRDIDWSPDEASLSKRWSTTPTTANKYVGVDTLGNRTEYTPAQLTKLISDYDNYKQSTTLSGNSFDEVSDVVGPAGSELMNIYKTMNGGVPVDPYSRESWGEFESWLNTQRSNTPTTAKGWAKKAGQRIVEDVNNSNLGNRVKDVGSSSYSQAARFVNDVLTGRLKGASDADVLRAFEKLPPSAQQDTITLGKDFLDDDFVETLAGTVRMQNRLGATTRQNSAFYIENENPTYMADDENYIRGYLGDKIVDENARSSYNDAARFITDIVSGDSKYKTDAEVLNSFRQLPADSQQDVLKIGNNWLSNEFMNTLEQNATPTTAKGWAKKAGQRIVEDINNSNLGNRVKDVSSEMPDDIRNMQIRDYNAGADGELTPSRFSRDAFEAGDDSRNELVKAINRYNSNTPEADRIMNLSNDGSTITMVGNKKKVPVEQMLGVLGMDNGDYNNDTITVEEALARAGINPSDTTRPQATAPVALDAWDRVAQEAGYSNYDEVLQRYAEANPNAKINPRGMAGQVLTWMDQNPGNWNPNTPTTASGWAKRAGQRAVEDINNSNLGLRVQDVSQDDPSKRLYNALAGNRQPVTETEVETDTDMGVVPSKTSKEGKLRYARGKELLRQYGTVDQPMARASRAVESVQEIADAGFTKPEDVERMTNVITGSNGEVSKLTRNLIKNAAPVDTFAGENGQTIEDFIDNSIQLNSLYDTNKGKAVKQTIEANLRSLPSRAAGSVTYTDNPEDVFKVVQNLEASAAELEGRGGSRYFKPTVENIHQAAVLKDTASLLKQRLFDGADVKQALTPEVAQNLKSYDPNNKKYADWVDNTIMKAESINDLRAAQAPFVRMSKYIDNAYTQAATVGGRMAENANDLSRILTTRNGLLKAGIDTLWNSNAARRGRAAVYDKLADRAADKAANTPDTAAGWAKQAGKRAAEDLGNTNLGNRIQDVSGQPVNPQVATPAELANTVADYNPSTQLYNAIGRTEGTLAQETPAQYLANAAQEAEIVSPMEAPTAPANDIATSMGNASTATYNALTGTPTTTQQANTGSINTGYYQPTGDYWTDIIASAMSAAIDANDVNAFASLFGMYQDQMANLQKQTSSEKDYSNPMNWSSADRTKLLSAQNAMGQIDQLEEAYNQATGGEGSNAVQGWLRSRASDISGGNWDPSASNYNSLSESVGMGIVKNLINLGVTEADAQRYLKYIPALTDTKEQAAQKLDTLRNTYQNQINNLYGVYGL